jgi:hypothetical protein
MVITYTYYGWLATCLNTHIVFCRHGGQDAVRLYRCHLHPVPPGPLDAGDEEASEAARAGGGVDCSGAERFDGTMSIDNKKIVRESKEACKYDLQPLDAPTLYGPRPNHRRPPQRRLRGSVAIRFSFSSTSAVTTGVTVDLYLST